jgi:hypothetical protein
VGPELNERCQDGAGWQFRKPVYESDDTGIRKRRLPYVAHLSKSAFAEMKKANKGAVDVLGH